MDENTNTPTHAADTGAENQPAAPENQGKADNTSEKMEKTFTQKELDDIVKQRLERAKKDMPSKEELKAFHDWKDSQKTDAQKAADEIAAANSAKEEAERDKRTLEIKVECLSKGVSPDYVNDVIVLAEKYVDDNTTIDKAVETVIAKYPAFCGKNPGQIAPGITTGTRTQQPPAAPSGKTSFIDTIRENQVKRK